MKIKKMPTLKERARYLVFKTHSKEALDYNDVKTAVWGSILNFLGEEQTARASVRIIRNLWKPKTGTGFLKCGHVYVDKIKVALGLINQIGDSKVIVQTLRVSGTIKSANKKMKE